MDRLLAVNGTMALYYHDDSVPSKKIDPFKYINALLSIRSAKGLVSFLQQYPEGLTSLLECSITKNPPHERKGPPDGDLKDEEESKSDTTSQESQADDENSPHVIKRKFDFGENAMMNAVEEFDIDYLDGMTDLEQYAHFDEVIRAWRERSKAAIPWDKETWSAEETQAFYDIHDERPHPELRCLPMIDLEKLVYRLENILVLAALSHDIIQDDELFTFEHVNGPMGLCLTTVPKHFVEYLLPVPEGVYTIGSHFQTIYSNAVERLHFKEDGHIYLVAHTNDEHLATREASGIFASFVLSEWANYYSKTDAMSYEIRSGYQLYERKNNEIVSELCHIVAEGRLGVCPVCERPFVVKRKPINGQINKRFCSNSCKVKGFNDARGGE